jgi:hypothetical protein
MLPGSAEAQTATGATDGVGFGFTVRRPEAVPVHCVVLSVTVTT